MAATIVAEEDVRLLKALAVQKTNQPLDHLNKYVLSPYVEENEKEIIYSFINVEELKVYEMLVIKVEKKTLRRQFELCVYKSILYGKKTLLTKEFEPNTNLQTLLREAKTDSEIIRALIDEKVKEVFYRFEIPP